MWKRLTIGKERLDAGNADAHYSLQRSLAAYAFARRYLADKVVLDAACGTGHGTLFLAGAARTLIGLDLSQEALAFAARTPYPNLGFCCGDLFKLPFQKETFDAILSFQVVEHFQSPVNYFEELSRVLRQGGVLFLATLNQKKTSHGLNPFHVHEYAFSEFAETVRGHFRKSEFFGVYGSPRYLEARKREAFFGQLFLRIDCLNLRRRLPRPFWEGMYTFGTYLVNAWVSRTTPAARQLTVEDFEIRTDNLEDALDFIAVCSKESP